MKFLKWALLYYLRFWAKVSLAKYKPYVIGVAGSAGKSSCRNALYAALKDYKKILMIKGNSETGIPLGILGLPIEGYSKFQWFKSALNAPFGIQNIKDASVLIVEMGIDEPDPPKNMEYLLTILKPTLAISLNVSGTHVMQFEKTLPQREMSEQERLEYLIQKIADEDTKIISKSQCEIGIYNANDKYIMHALENFLNNKTQLFTFGNNKNDTIQYKNYKIEESGTSFEFLVENEKIELHFHDLLLPQVYQETFAAVILAAFKLGISFVDIKKSLEKNFTLPAGRSSLFSGIKNTTIIDSSYNSSRRSVISFLDLARELKQKTKKEVVFLCGDMNELGKEAKMEHEALLDPILETADYLYCVGPETEKHIYKNLHSKDVNKKTSLKDLAWFKNSVELGKYIEGNLPENSIVLVKGSQNRVFLEEAIKYILKNKDDIKKLCRQEKYWMKMKERYFNK